MVTGTAPRVPCAGELANLLERARAGDPAAQLNAGAAFDHGLAGAGQDLDQAMGWYRLAAAAGLAEAQFNAAHLLVTRGIAPSRPGEARHWMRRAASQGMVDAMWLLGVMLADGVHGARDPSEAEVWLRRAAQAGHSEAAARLAKLALEP